VLSYFELKKLAAEPRVTQNRPTIKPGTLTLTRGPIASVSMSNVLSEEKKQQVIALGKLGWPLRRIEQATGVRRETAGAYLKAAGIGARPPGAWGRRAPANPANEMTTDLADSKPANEVTTDFSPPISPPTGNQDRVVSACEPFREWIEQGLARGRKCYGHLAGPGF
jgi:hypothetical protein